MQSAAKPCIAEIARQHVKMTLFLDFDGVLHPPEVYLISGMPKLRDHEPGEYLFCWLPDLTEVLEGIDVDIVLSTSWKDHLGLERAVAYLSGEIRSRILGSTANQAKERITRYQAIERYVAEHDLGDAWVALDDDMFGWPDEKRWHLVRSIGIRGISCPELKRELRDKLERRL
jgi:hypothetical protein